MVAWVRGDQQGTATELNDRRRPPERLSRATKSRRSSRGWLDCVVRREDESLL